MALVNVTYISVATILQSVATTPVNLNIFMPSKVDINYLEIYLELMKLT